MTQAFGLDFGTTNSALARASADGEVRLAQFGGGATFRSILYFDEDESSSARKLRVVAGPDAIQNYLHAKTPGRLIQSTKSYLASRLFTQTQIFGETYALEELIGILLRQLRRAAETQFGELGNGLAVGRPVHFTGTKDDGDDEFAVERLRRAFASAGFTDVRFLPEPIAAAYKYQRGLEQEELALIADFGGGTSDFSLVQLRRRGSSPKDAAAQVLGTTASASPATLSTAASCAAWSRRPSAWARNTNPSSEKFYRCPTGSTSISSAGTTCRF